MGDATLRYHEGVRLVQLFMPMPLSLEGAVTFRKYYGKLWQYFLRHLLRRGKKQMIGLGLAVAVLACQIYFHAIPSTLTLANVRSVGWPYLGLGVLLCLDSLLRAPVILDRERRRVSNTQIDAINKLAETNAKLTDELAQPKVNPHVQNAAWDGWNMLSPHETKAMKLLLELGEMTDDNAVHRLNLNQMAIFGGIESKTNFVHRTEGTQPHEHQIGYKGRWKINPHFADALEQIIKERMPD